MTTFRALDLVEGDMGPSSRRDAEFTAFVEEHGKTLLRAAHFLTGDRWQAEDLVQLALTKTYLAWPSARGQVTYAYARQALLSCHTDTWRRRRWREESTAPEDLPSHTSSTPTGARGDHAHGIAERDALEQALAQLTARERAVLVLRHLEDLSEKDAARLLNVSVGTIKSVNARALDKLRSLPTAQAVLGTTPTTDSMSRTDSHVDH